MQNNPQSIIDITPKSIKWNFSDPVYIEGRRVLKIPIAVKGEWPYGKLGNVSLNQNDLDQIVRNWKEVRAGYDPPLFFGHPIPTTSIDGEPSEGWPEVIYQEGDVLYGEYEPTNPSLFSDIEAKRYRHASAEVLRNAKDKVTGEDLGTMLVGVALTNRPYLPLKDHTIEIVEKFSDNRTDTSLILFTFDSESEGNADIDMTTVTTPVETIPEAVSDVATTSVATPAIATTSVASIPVTSSVTSEPNLTDMVSLAEYNKLLEQLAAQTASLSDMVPRSEYNNLATELASLASKFSNLEQSYSDTQAKEKARETQLKLAKLQELNIPATLKQTFSDMITAGTLPVESEAKLFSDYQNLSKENEKLYKFSQGASQTTTNQQVEMPEYYSAKIAENQKILEARKAAQANPQYL